MAVTAIFYFHVGVNTHYPLSQYGHYAVGFFIVLAGVAYLNFSRTRVTDLRTCLHYFFNRLWALFPIFLAVNLLIFAASYVYPSGLGRPYSAGELVLSSLGLSQYFGYRYLSVVMWFVPFILQVYLLLPVVHWLLREREAGFGDAGVVPGFVWAGDSGLPVFSRQGRGDMRELVADIPAA